MNFSGSLTDLNGEPLTGTVGVTFSLYQQQQGGAPLWLETQNVKPNSIGRYTVMLGSTTSQGIPANIFASGEAHWLGVQVQGQAEQPRVLLVSAPYALKSGDAETLGGKPASAFMAAFGNAASGNVNTPTITGTGKKDYVPLWLSATKLGSSKLFQSTAGNLGISTTSPAASLDVNGTGDIRNTLTLFPNGSSPTLSINGTMFNVSDTGLVSFVGGQTFPGTATLGANTFTGNQTFNGTTVFNGAITAPLTLSNNGIFTSTQENGYSIVNLNAASAGSILSSAGLGFSTDAFQSAIIIPSTSNVHQIDGIGTYITDSANSSSATNNNAVGGFFWTQCIANATACWGINPAVNDKPGTSPFSLKGIELDVSIYGTPGEIEGLEIVGAPITGTFPAAPSLPYKNFLLGHSAAIEIDQYSTSSSTWPVGLLTSDGSINGPVIIAGATAYNGSSPSQPIELVGNDGTNAHHVEFQGSSLGDLYLIPSVGRVTQLNGYGSQNFSAYPACSAAYEGAVIVVKDSTTTTWGATITGGSSGHVLGYCDGTNYTVMGK